MSTNDTARSRSISIDSPNLPPKGKTADEIFPVFASNAGEVYKKMVPCNGSVAVVPAAVHMASIRSLLLTT